MQSHRCGTRTARSRNRFVQRIGGGAVFFCLRKNKRHRIERCVKLENIFHRDGEPVIRVESTGLFFSSLPLAEKRNIIESRVAASRVKGWRRICLPPPHTLTEEVDLANSATLHGTVRAPTIYNRWRILYQTLLTLEAHTYIIYRD